MVEKQFKVIEKTGLHARPATLLVKTANKFKSNMNLEYKGKKANLKSIVGLMSLGVSKGDEIKIRTEGIDEIEALEMIENTLKRERVIE